MGAALQKTVVRELQLDELLQQELKSCLGARDPNSPIGSGVREVFSHVRCHVYPPSPLKVKTAKAYVFDPELDPQ